MTNFFYMRSTMFSLDKLKKGKSDYQPFNIVPRCEATDELLAMIDVLVDGKFILAKKNIRLKFRGSENQRILDLPETLKTGQPVMWKEE